MDEKEENMVLTSIIITSFVHFKLCLDQSKNPDRIDYGEPPTVEQVRQIYIDEPLIGIFTGIMITSILEWKKLFEKKKGDRP